MKLLPSGSDLDPKFGESAYGRSLCLSSSHANSEFQINKYFKKKREREESMKVFAAQTVASKDLFQNN